MTDKNQEGAEIANLLMQTTGSVKKPTLPLEQTGNNTSDMSESEEEEEEEEGDEEALAAVMNATAGTADSTPAPASAPAVAAAPTAAPTAAAAPAAAAPAATPAATAPAAAPAAVTINYVELGHQIDYSRIFTDPTKVPVDNALVAKHLDISRLAEHVVKLMPTPAPPAPTPPPVPKRVVVPINPHKTPAPTAETPKEEEKEEVEAPVERKFFAPAGMRPIKPPADTRADTKVDTSKDEKTEVDVEVEDRVEEPDSWLTWVSYGLLGLLLLGVVVLGLMDYLSDPVDQNSDRSDSETTLVATPEATPIAPATSTNVGQSTCVPRIDLARAPSSRAARLQLNCGQDVVCEEGITYDTRETTDADGNRWLDLRGRPNASNRADRIGCALQ